MRRNFHVPPEEELRRMVTPETVPTNLLVDILGKERMMRFVVREIVTSAVASYVEENNIIVKDDKISTTQTEDERNESFLPENDFGFIVEVQIANEEPDADVEVEITNEETESEATSNES